MKKILGTTKHTPIEPAVFGRAIIDAYKLDISTTTPPDIIGLETQKFGFATLQIAAQVFERLPVLKEAFQGERYIATLGLHAVDRLFQSFNIQATYNLDSDCFDTDLGKIKTKVVLPEIRSLELKKDDIGFDILAVLQLDWLHCVYTDFSSQQWIIISNSNKFVIPFTPVYEPSQKTQGGRLRFLGFDFPENIENGRGWGVGMSITNPSKLRALDFDPSYSPLSFIQLLQGAGRV